MAVEMEEIKALNDKYEQ
jgi:hypothetical protein